MNTKAFTKAGYGLYVVTTGLDERDNGCIINTFMQITSNSPLYAMLSLNKQNYTTELLEKTGKCNINALSEKTPFDVFKNFGYQSGRTISKFPTEKKYERSENGLIVLSEYSTAVFQCSVTESFDFGTHLVYKVEIIDAECILDEESVTYSYYQQHIKPKPETKQQTTEVGKHIWRCTICGYEYEGDPLPDDFICPWCKHGAADFVRV